MGLAARIAELLSHGSAHICPAIGLMRAWAGTWLSLVLKPEAPAVGAGAMWGQGYMGLEPAAIFHLTSDNLRTQSLKNAIYRT